MGLDQTKTALTRLGASILPVEWTGAYATPINGTRNCTFHSNWMMAQNFFANSSVDFSTIALINPKFVQESKDSSGHDVLAVAFESNIYLLEDECELNPTTFVHEL